MDGEQGQVLVMAELGPDKALLPLSLECVTGALRLAGAMGRKTAGLVMGSDAAGAAREMARFGLDAVYVADHPALEAYHPELFLSAFIQVYERLRPGVILMADTLISADLAPRIAFRLETALVTDCVRIETGPTGACFVKPVYSSNVMAAYTLASEPWLITLRPRTEEQAAREEPGRGEVIPIEVAVDPADARIEVLEAVTEEEQGPELASADIIVAGGRGMGGTEGFERLERLAGLLNGAVGASRPPCDLGWISPKAQVGQTGEKVAPSLYIAVGISGTTQHISGMSGSKTVVAVNKDPKAHIFRIADYGVVGPYEEVLPAFEEALRELIG